MTSISFFILREGAEQRTYEALDSILSAICVKSLRRCWEPQSPMLPDISVACLRFLISISKFNKANVLCDLLQVHWTLIFI